MPTVSLYLKDELYQQLIRTCIKTGETWQDIVREALNDYLTRQKTLPG